MNDLPRNALGGVRIGFWFSVITVATEVGGHWLFGDELRWRGTLFSAALMPVLFGVGGGIHGLLLPHFARDRTQPSRRARLLAGMAAGALTGAVLGAPYLLRETRGEMISHTAFMLMGIGLGMAVGAVCAFFARSAASRLPPA